MSPPATSSARSRGASSARCCSSAPSSPSSPASSPPPAADARGFFHCPLRIDGLLEALDNSSATPAPALFPRPERRASLQAFLEGFSLHAATRVMASDRRGLWRLCAWGARGALAASRLSELPDGRFAIAMKRLLPDGRARLVLTGALLLEKLVPLIPPVYANLTRFHGVFAPTSRLRAKV